MTNHSHRPPEASAYRKSTFSNNESGCIEVASTPDGACWVRDTKDRTLPPHRYTSTAWNAFLASVRRGEFQTR